MDTFHSQITSEQGRLINIALDENKSTAILYAAKLVEYIDSFKSQAILWKPKLPLFEPRIQLRMQMARSAHRESSINEKVNKTKAATTSTKALEKQFNHFVDSNNEIPLTITYRKHFINQTQDHFEITKADADDHLNQLLAYIAQERERKRLDDSLTAALELPSALLLTFVPRN